MKKLMKKVATLCLAGVTAMSTVGVTGSAVFAKGDTNYDVDNMDFENVELRVAFRFNNGSDTDGQAKWYYKALEEFNKENEGKIHVTDESISTESDYEEKLTTDFASGNVPNAFLQYGGSRTREYVDAGYILDLTPYFEQYPEWKEGVQDFAWETTQFDGIEGTYGIPWSAYQLCLYYNKDYLKECGVDTDDLDSRTLENPLTTDEVAEIAEKCTTDDYVGTHIIMDHGEGLPYALEPLYLSAGKDYISEDGKEADGYVNSEEAVNTTSWLADLIAKGYANVEPITDEFLNGACATMLGGSWEIATLEQNADFDWGVTYYPVNAETKKAVSPCGDWAAAISKDCENADAAGEFLAWLMNTDNVASYAAAIAKPATRSSAYETEAMTEYKEGARALIVDQLENTAVPRPRTPSYATFSAAYAEAMTNIFSDAASNEEADTDYIQSEFDTVVDTFTEDYETYYAE